MDLTPFTNKPCVAYFSMEVALQPEIPTYSGGLGVLAGDTLRSCVDLELPVVGVSLASRQGYFKQTIDSQGWQQEAPDPWTPGNWATPLEAKITVPINGRPVWVGGWLFILEGQLQRRRPIILLDTDLEENDAENRRITDVLYGGNDEYRLKQEVVLGIGGVRMLGALGFQIFHYHMNEGHSALLALELLRSQAVPPEDLHPGESPYSMWQVREQCSFTTHTPVEAGHDKFSYSLVNKLLDGYFDVGVIRSLAGSEHMNMTQLALNLSESVNGVTKRHAEVSRIMFPQHLIRGITNGVHPLTWTSASFIQLYNTHFPGWCHEPEMLIRADCCVADDAVWDAHVMAQTQLLEYVSKTTGVMLDPELPLLGFARRMTAYKRPELLFSDLGRLREIARGHPFQLILAGKAHPADQGGKSLIEFLHRCIREVKDDIRIVYLPDYNMSIARLLVAGVDVWLNTPAPPLEASGTSGMKAAFNGVPNLSVLDGWWIEGCIEGITGWSIGDGRAGDPEADAAALYKKLADTVLPLYSDNRAAWIKLMKGAISKNASYFNSQRMMRRYVTETYIR